MELETASFKPFCAVDSVKTNMGHILTMQRAWRECLSRARSFSYKNMCMYGSVPTSLHSYTKLKRKPVQGAETISCSVVLTDKQGILYAEVEHYTV
ncbi:hypothetical protein [Paenibacillus taiwanensis]|uniref:hypothetical protein n=1 Tax=Paenibacillus taiwanensis TaxID=401638 RepID=UPI0004179C1C|nr:hypothetical protein [Paenibacillus taiwanensis]